MESWVQAIVTGTITGLFSAGAVWGALKIELKYLRRDTDHAHKRLDDHEVILHNHRRVWP